MSCEVLRSSLHQHWLLAFCLCCIIAALPSYAQPLDGFWKSDGYGLLIEIHNESIQAFETTSISCIRSWSAYRTESRLLMVQLYSSRAVALFAPRQLKHLQARTLRRQQVLAVRLEQCVLARDPESLRDSEFRVQERNQVFPY